MTWDKSPIVTFLVIAFVMFVYLDIRRRRLRALDWFLQKWPTAAIVLICLFTVFNLILFWPDIKKMVRMLC
jgi:hypothetical protein